MMRKMVKNTLILKRFLFGHRRRMKKHTQTQQRPLSAILIALLVLGLSVSSVSANPLLGFILNSEANQAEGGKLTFGAMVDKLPKIANKLDGHGTLITTKLGISEHVLNDPELIAAETDLSDVTYSVTWTGTGISPEEVKTFIKKAGIVEAVLGSGIHDETKLNYVVEKKPINSDLSMATFAAIWLEATQQGVEFVDVNVDYEMPFLAGVQAGTGLADQFVSASYAADQKTLDVSQLFATFGPVNIGLVPGSEDGALFMDTERQSFSTDEKNQLWYKGGMLGHGMTWDLGADLQHNKMDYADALKRRVGDDGTTGVSFKF